MLKLLLCAASFALCVLFAWLMTRRYKRRRDFYYDFSLFNERLYNEVSYAREPLPAFLAKQHFRADFQKAVDERQANGFRGGGSLPACLREEEGKFLDDYFAMIGKSDAASQRSFLASQRAEVEERRRTSEEAYKKRRSLYLKLGVLAGLMLVILIV